MVVVGVLGSLGAGKSSLTMRYFQDVFMEEYDPTIEDYYTKQISHNKILYQLNILDMGGGEDISACRDNILQKSEGSLLVYSITNLSTFEYIEAHFQRQIVRNKLLEKAYTIFLVGCKCDLEHRRKVSLQEGKELASKYGWAFYETSALLGHNTSDVFVDMVASIIEKRCEKSKRKSSSCIMF